MNNSDETFTETLANLSWSEDMLGPGFESADLPLAPAPDGDDQDRAVIVRATSEPSPGKPAIVWIHGMTDYFFHSHVAQHYTAQGYPFYAVDMHGCGRAHVDGGRWHYTTDMAHYFTELTRAARLIAAEHGQIIPMAHSTGGLIVPLWAHHLRSKDPASHSALRAIILNSPWLDMQFPRLAVAALRPLVTFLGNRFPTLMLPNKGEGTYGESISASAHGEWEFDTTFKPVGGHPKYLGWLRAVFQAQKDIHEGIMTGVPTLTLCSAHSYLGKPYSPAADTADTVLDVAQIRRWAPTLSHRSTVEVIEGARHDVFLSERHAREAALSATDAWLDSLGEQADKEAHR
ncbi:alpha/beta hydrolase [Corynebacterium liangguodongii]|uniref:Alpha/beta hydrolase n=1 Tax=Corynebacterium liangguodongii TaxID=2079535 RepID=A0A2S0WEQ0_9CORY|nr:alpha/beta hydrolase [Corynebacterium liangguodongii]AWB84236.1 alpha/beta hydrolase [Corynebacterium liangguodongii]PWC00245.1 alpha/beta hydrolase [Corynebacterium liangguodongii]